MLDDEDAPIVAGVLTAADRSAVARLSAIELEDTDACASAVEFEDSDVAPTDVGGVELPTIKRAKVVKVKVKLPRLAVKVKVKDEPLPLKGNVEGQRSTLKGNVAPASSCE